MNERMMEFEQMKESFFIRKMRHENLQYCVFEDMAEKNYIVFDSEKNFDIDIGVYDNCRVLRFGGIVFDRINTFIKCNPESPHHSSFKEELSKQGLPDVDKRVSECHDIYADTLKELLRYIKHRDTYKYHDEAALECSYIREWKKYRYMLYTDVWKEIVSLMEAQEKDHNLSGLFSDEELKEIVESCHREADELSGTLHKIVSEMFFVPYDEIYFMFVSKWVHGKVWFARNEDDIFSRDLYHVLVDKAAESPHICPRCGLLYYSNNNKSKYCPECKMHSNDIRKENIKKNPARYTHKRVWDKINAHKDKYDKDFLNAFMNESNYYWYNISGKKSDLQRLDSYQNIDTIEKYQEWLDKKLASL